eukprot:scaffold112130_cov40-Phaeocystis_antarctica.AAC.1
MEFLSNPPPGPARHVFRRPPGAAAGVAPASTGREGGRATGRACPRSPRSMVLHRGRGRGYRSGGPGAGMGLGRWRMDGLCGDGTACLSRRVRYRRGRRLVLAPIPQLPVDARAAIAEEVCEERRGGGRTLPRWRRRCRLVAVRRCHRNACRGCDTAR